MKLITSLFSLVVTGVVIIGITKGIQAWNAASGGGVGDLLVLAVTSVADVTQWLLGLLVGMFSNGGSSR